MNTDPGNGSAVAGSIGARVAIVSTTARQSKFTTPPNRLKKRSI
jgi:hypothetical protein